MKILLLHPEDSAPSGPWIQQNWDLLVDLGKSSESAAARWARQLSCPVLRLDSFRQSTNDLSLVAQTMRAGNGRLLDSEGLDWWELISILIHAELEISILLRRLATELSGDHELYATRTCWQANALAALLMTDVRNFGGRSRLGIVKTFKHYGRLLQNLSLAQVFEIALDKYDPQYKWRRSVSRRRPSSNSPVVLVPTAYSNVSRMAAEYARMLPGQEFLFVATRRSARQFEPSANVRLADLACYSPEGDSRDEFAHLLHNWQLLLCDMQQVPEMRILFDSGKLAAFSHFFRQGLAVRNLWRGVLTCEPVSGVLCGDDSNPFTRLPVLLARKRGFPTTDFHHGALDGRFLLKALPSDIYLAKSEMERDYLARICGMPSARIFLGAPHRDPVRPVCAVSRTPTRIVFFSEPYESAGARAEEIYRELVPALAQLARHTGKKLIIKLHPFESIAQRRRLVNTILPPESSADVELMHGPLDHQMLLETWFGITVESTAVIDCSLQGVPCFLCQWLSISSYGYTQQYARFRVGSLLGSAGEIPNIPGQLEHAQKSVLPREMIWHSIEPSLLRQYLTGLGTMVDDREERVRTTLVS